MRRATPLAAGALALSCLAIAYAASTRDAQPRQPVPAAVKDLWIGTLEPVPADPTAGFDQPFLDVAFDFVLSRSA